MRASSRAARVLVNSRNFATVLAVARFVVAWARLKQGKADSSAVRTLRLSDCTLTLDLSRMELVPYLEIWHEHCYDQDPEFAREGSNLVVDVGANAGLFSLYQVLRKGAKKVIAFEPSPGVFSRLTQNISQNACSDRITALNVAAGSVDGKTFLEEGRRSLENKVANSGVPIDIVRLDSALPDEPIDLLKIDTEGHEVAVLQGAANVLLRTKRVALEIHRACDFDPISDLLTAAGFHLAAQVGSLEDGALYWTKFQN